MSVKIQSVVVITVDIYIVWQSNCLARRVLEHLAIPAIPMSLKQHLEDQHENNITWIISSLMVIDDDDDDDAHSFECEQEIVHFDIAKTKTIEQVVISQAKAYTLSVKVFYVW